MNQRPRIATAVFASVLLWALGACEGRTRTDYCDRADDNCPGHKICNVAAHLCEAPGAPGGREADANVGRGGRGGAPGGADAGGIMTGGVQMEVERRPDAPVGASDGGSVTFQPSDARPDVMLPGDAAGSCEVAADCASKACVAGRCVQCAMDSQCPMPRPLCTAANQCVPCWELAAPDTCGSRGAGTPVCEPKLGKCVECNSNADCKLPTQPMCAYNRCVECMGSLQCPDARPICAADRCTTCTTVSQCTSRSSHLIVCTSAGRCVACDSNNNCSGATPGCLKAPGAEPRCAACSEDKHCPASAPVCGPTTGVCGVCTLDAECVLRDPNTRACVMGKCVQCRQSAHCPDALKPVCGIAGYCVPIVCGDGVVSGTEECDLGSQNTPLAYGMGECTDQCKVAPYCGDGKLSSREECDQGAANKINAYGAGLCSIECKKAGFCGDSVQNGDEKCDNGGSGATELGSCNPQCAGFFEKKLIWETQGRFAGNMGGPSGADQFCRNEFGGGWKALLVGGGRRATITPFKGDGQTDWVVQKYMYYYNDANELIWRTDGAALLGVRDGAKVTVYGDVFSQLAHYPWGGYRSDWTEAPDNRAVGLESGTCSGWTSSSGDLNGTFPLQDLTVGRYEPCAATEPLLCVQQ